MMSMTNSMMNNKPLNIQVITFKTGSNIMAKITKTTNAYNL